MINEMVLLPLVALTAMGIAITSANAAEVNGNQSRIPSSQSESTIPPQNPTVSRALENEAACSNQPANQQGIDKSTGAKEQSSAPPGSDAHAEMPNKSVQELEAENLKDSEKSGKINQ